MFRAKGAKCAKWEILCKLGVLCAKRFRSCFPTFLIHPPKNLWHLCNLWMLSLLFSWGSRGWKAPPTKEENCRLKISDCRFVVVHRTGADATERVPPRCGQRGGRRVAPPSRNCPTANRHSSIGNRQYPHRRSAAINSFTLSASTCQSAAVGGSLGAAASGATPLLLALVVARALVRSLALTSPAGP